MMLTRACSLFFNLPSKGAMVYRAMLLQSENKSSCDMLPRGETINAVGLLNQSAVVRVLRQFAADDVVDALQILAARAAPTPHQHMNVRKATLLKFHNVDQVLDGAKR